MPRFSEDFRETLCVALIHIKTKKMKRGTKATKKNMHDLIVLIKRSEVSFVITLHMKLSKEHFYSVRVIVHVTLHKQMLVCFRVYCGSLWENGKTYFSSNV